jgi:hypothetical protein
MPVDLSDYVLVLSQVQGDSVLELARFSSGQMILTVQRAAARCGRPAVVKFHPRCDDLRFRAVIGVAVAKCGARIVDAYIDDLLSRAALVAVVNSGTGFEALLRLRTVMTFGRCDYQTATHPITDLDEVMTIMSGYPGSRIPPERITAFLDAFLGRHQISMRDPDFERKIAAMVRTKAATGTIGQVPL